MVEDNFDHLQECEEDKLYYDLLKTLPCDSKIEVGSKTKSSHIKPEEELCKQRKAIKDTIQQIVLDIIKSLSSEEEPGIMVRNQRIWNNCIFTEMEVYYENLALFDEQSQLDSVADKISCLLGVPQWETGLLASSKGMIAGALRIISSSIDIDCSVKGGVLIPNELPNRTRLMSNAKFVLIVEKDSAFQKLYDEGFLERHGPCIMITGKGYPDVNTRLMVSSIWKQLSLPMYILVDSDPYGIEIMCIYKYGSLKQSHIGDRLAVPSVKWLGLHPTDMSELNIKSKALSTTDIKKTQFLLTRPYIVQDEKIRHQIHFLFDSGKKSEIEGIVQISNGYLTDVYIPMKILSKQYI